MFRILNLYQPTNIVDQGIMRIVIFFDQQQIDLVVFIPYLSANRIYPLPL